MINEDVRKYTRFNFFIVLATTILTLTLSIYLDTIGYSFSQIGYMYSFFPLTIIIFLPIIGHVSDLIGKKLVLLIALICEIISISLYLIDGYVIIIILARILEGIAASTLATITLAKIEDKITEKRGENTGLYLSIGSIAALISSPIAFVLGNYFSIKIPIILSLTIFTFLFIRLFSYRKLHFVKIKKTDLNYFSNIKNFLSYPGLCAMGLLGIAKHGASIAINVYLSLYLIKYFNYSYNIIGVIFFVFLFPKIFQVLVGKFTDKNGSQKAIITGLIFDVIAYIGIIFSTQLYHFIFFVLIMGIGSAIWNTSAWHYMSNIGEKSRIEGQIVTTYLGIAKLGALISTLISGYIFEFYSYQTLLLLHIFSLLTFIIISSFFFKKQEKIDS